MLGLGRFLFWCKNIAYYKSSKQLQTANFLTGPQD